jgi:hypothetical protein
MYEIKWEVDTDFSEEYPASNFSSLEKVGKDGSKHVFENSISAYKTRWCFNLEDHNWNVRQSGINRRDCQLTA